jgi:hypothetical protein
VYTLLHATVYKFLHNLLNVLVQIANKMGLQKKKVHIEVLWVASLYSLVGSLQLRWKQQIVLIGWEALTRLYGFMTQIVIKIIL